MRERVRSHTPFSHLSEIWLKGGLVSIFKSEPSSTFRHFKTLLSLSNTTFFLLYNVSLISIKITYSSLHSRLTSLRTQYFKIQL